MSTAQTDIPNKPHTSSLQTCLSPWFLPQVPETRLELPSCVSPSHVVAVNSSSSSGYCPTLLLPFKAKLLERVVFTTSTFWPPVLSGADSSQAVTPITLANVTKSPSSAILGTLPTPLLPLASRYLPLLVLSFLTGYSFLVSFPCSSLFFSWISKFWNSAGLSSWSFSLFYLCFILSSDFVYLYL